MKLTVKQIAEKLKCNPEHARGLITFMAGIDIAPKAGKADKVPGTKGQAADLFDIPDDAGDKVKQAVDKLK